MKAKRIIKGFIYLFPFMILFINALCLIIPTIKLNNVLDGAVPSGTINNQDYAQALIYNRRINFEDWINPITTMGDLFVNSDDMPIYDSWSSILDSAGLHADDNGEAQRFFTLLLTYESYAIIICAIIDVIFLIPEFYNKIEDKYIKGGKKRE